MKQDFSQIKKLLLQHNLDALLITSHATITHLTQYSNFSNSEREAYIFITKNNTYIITDARYSEAVEKEIPHFKLLEISHTNSLKNILTTEIKTNKIKKVGFENLNLTVAEYELFKKNLPVTFIPLNDALVLKRVIKTTKEISHIKKACEIGDKAFTFILPYIKPGITEKELALELELFIRKQNAHIAFDTIVAFGKNSSIPHHQTGNDTLQKNSFVLLDFGVLYNNYRSDMSRTVFFGSPTEEQKKMHSVVLDAQKKAIEYLTSNYSLLTSNKLHASDIDKTAREYIVSQGYPSIPHSVGHGIGIEVHELPNISPNSKTLLKEGMVFSIEPGIYKKGFGGVRIEDLITISKYEIKLLTNAPRTFIKV